MTAELSVAVAATAGKPAVKRAALLTHASQSTQAMLSDRFEETDELEWFLRRGPVAVHAELGNVHGWA